jgi:hypothetical protein
VSSQRSRRKTPLGPDSDSGALSFGKCGNCGAGLTGRFCSQCGEKQLTPRDYTVGHFLEDAIDGFTHLDTKFLRTFKLLIRKPGELSNAFFHGGRSRYTKPLSLFIIINIVFFLVQPHTGLFGYKYAHYVTNPSHLSAVQGHLAKTRESPVTYAARFDANLQNQKKSLLIVAVPVLALFMLIIFAGTGRTYAEHLVFSVQVYAFLLAYLAATAFFFLLPIILALHATGSVGISIARRVESEFSIDLVLLVGVTVYMYLGFRRAYQTSRIRSGISAILLSSAVGLLIGLYHNLLFYVVFWTT